MPKHEAANWLELLESRCLLSAVYPTDVEQYVVELVNRARANPAAEAAKYGIALNEGLPAGTITDAARQPLAVNPFLVDSAREHSQWMIEHETFSHTGVNGSDPGDRMAAAGYTFDAPWSWAENIALRSYKTGSPHTDVYDAIERDLFVDIGIDDRGHRVNLLSARNNEIGVGAASGAYSYYKAAMLTQDMASAGDSTFLTGVIYTDTVSKDKFYTPGEGLGDVTVTATRVADGATFSTRSWSAGGYSLKLAAGTYKVTASGGKLGQTITLDSVTIGQDNVKRDFTPAPATPTPTPTPTPAPKPKPTPTPTPPKSVPDTAAPRAAIHAPRKREASNYYQFTVTYTDATAVNVATLGDGDLMVKAGGGYARAVRLVGVDSHANGKTRTATYEVKGPKGVFNRVHNGLYTVWIAAGQIKDTAGNAIPPQQLGAFTVRIPKAVAAATPAPAVTASTKKKTTSDVLK